MRTIVGWAGVSGIVATAAVIHPPSRSLPEAREVIRRHVEAVGGAEALSRISSRYVWAKYEIPARHIQGSVEVYAARPNRRVIKIAYPEIGAEVSGFDGVRGWTVAATGAVKAIGGKQLLELRDLSSFDFDLHPDSLFRAMETVDDADFEGRPCFKLRLTGTSQRTWSEFYDRKTGLFAGSIGPHETDKEPVTMKMVVGEYANYGGVRIPTRITIRTAGVEEVIRVRDVKVNEVNDSKFDVPAKLRGSATP